LLGCASARLYTPEHTLTNDATVGPIHHRGLPYARPRTASVINCFYDLLRISKLCPLMSVKKTAYCAEVKMFRVPQSCVCVQMESMFTDH